MFTKHVISIKKLRITLRIHRSSIGLMITIKLTTSNIDDKFILMIKFCIVDIYNIINGSLLGTYTNI